MKYTTTDELNQFDSTPCRNMNRLGQLRFFKSFWFQWIPMRYQFFFPENYLNDTAQFREDHMEIYI